MKNKKVVIILTSMIVLIGGIFLINNIFQNKDKFNKTKRKKQNNLAIMIKDNGASDYIKLNSKDIPKGNYTLNREKSYCKNNGTIGDYDSALGKVSFSFIGTDSCYLYFDYEVQTRIGYEAILLDNGNGATTVEDAKTYIEGKKPPDFSKVATTNEGMYAADDDYTATTGMKSYYFRGAVNNNWVKFGKDSSGNPIYWRIIRINGDGSIRLIYSGVTNPSTEQSVINSNGVYMTGTTTQINISEFANSSDNPAYVGYMYNINNQHGISTSSTIKTIIDNWFKETSLENDENIKKLLVDRIFCNDRQAALDGSTPSELPAGVMSSSKTYYYGTYSRLNTNKNPSLICPSNKDKFTISASMGNGTLIYPVGLITADEVSMAGSINENGSTGNNSYYLYTNCYYWLNSPAIYLNVVKNAAVYAVHSFGNIVLAVVNDAYGVRPVINISSSVKLSGDGTYNNVYTVS